MRLSADGGDDYEGGCELAPPSFILLLEIPGLRGCGTYRKISPNQAPFPETGSGPVPDKPVKPSVSVRVETGLF
jgi:hypothetical protein